MKGLIIPKRKINRGEGVKVHHDETNDTSNKIQEEDTKEKENNEDEKEENRIEEPKEEEETHEEPKEENEEANNQNDVQQEEEANEEKQDNQSENEEKEEEKEEEIPTEIILFSTLSKEDKIKYFNFFIANDTGFEHEPEGTWIAEIDVFDEDENNIIANKKELIDAIYFCIL